MSKLFAAIGVALLISMLFLSQTAYASESEDNITLANSPQITINVSNNVDVNVSYWGIILSTNNTTIGATFEGQTWSFSNTTSGFGYESSFMLKPISGSDLGDFYKQFLNTSAKQDELKSNNFSLGIKAFVNVSKYQGPISSLQIQNTSSGTSSNLDRIDSSTLKTSFSVVFDAPYPIGNYSMYLVQSLKGSEDSVGLSFENVSAYTDNATYSGVAMQNSSATDNTKALYWWNSNFSYNGKTGTTNSSIVHKEEGIYLVYEFKAAGKTGNNVLSQDPYISVSGFNLLGSKITHLVQGAVNYFLQHVEFSLGGFGAGAVIMMIFYVKHARGRIRI
ncbi:MAG: hypothetical protein ACYCT2_06560 [Thermoplasmataceae archaeon]